MVGSVKGFVVASIVALAASAAARAQGSTPGLVWTSDASNGSLYVRSVSIGDGGGQVLVGIPGPGGRVRLLSAYSSGVGATIWETAPVHDLLGVEVDSAEDAPVHAAFMHERTSSSAPSRSFVRIWTGAGAQPTEYEVPIPLPSSSSLGLDVDHAGTRVVATLHELATGLAHIVVFQPGIAQPVASWQTQIYTPIVTTRLSADGQRLYLCSSVYERVVDLANGQSLHAQLLDAGVTQACGLDSAGAVGGALRTNGRVYLFHPSGATLAPWFDLAPPTGLLISHMAVRADGSQLAVALYSTTQPGSISVRFVDLAAPGHPWGEGVALPSSPANYRILDLQYCGDDRLVACVSKGTEPFPELVSFRRSPSGWQVEWQADLAGSPLRLDASRSGRFAVVSHQAQSSQVVLSTLTGVVPTSVDLSLDAPPSSGTSRPIRVWGTPGQSATLLVATALSQPPVFLPGIGTLYVSTANLVRHPLGVIGASGSLSTTWTVPPGGTRWLQTVMTGPRRAGTTLLQVTPLP